MTSRIHSILPRIAIWSLVAIPVTVYVLYRSWTRVYEVPRGEDIFAVLQGTWALSGSDSSCRTDGFRITFSPDHRAMTMNLGRAYALPGGGVDSLVRYEVLQHTRSTIRAVRRGETRVTRDSQPVVWDYILKSPDSYTRHRTDWPLWLQAPPIRRCTTSSTGLH